MTDRRRGFTLLEVILAMVALAMVTVVCYGAFHLGIRAVERGEVAVVTAQRLRVASDVFIRQIKSTVAYPARNDDDEVYPYFIGSETSMAFITAAGLHGGGGLTRVAYQVVDDPPRLIVSESAVFSPDSLASSAPDRTSTETAVLLDGFRSLKFGYFMNDGIEIDRDPRPTFDGQEEEMLPIAVRVTVEGLPGIETGTWAQEIPIMATTYVENTGEVDDEELPDRVEDEGTGNEGGSGAGPGSRRGSGDDDEEGE